MSNIFWSSLTAQANSVSTQMTNLNSKKVVEIGWLAARIRDFEFEDRSAFDIFDELNDEDEL